MSQVKFTSKQAKPTTYNFANGAKFQPILWKRQPEDFPQANGKMIAVFHVTACPLDSSWKESCIEKMEFPYFTYYGLPKNDKDIFDISIVDDSKGRRAFSINQSETITMEANIFHGLLGIAPIEESVPARTTAPKGKGKKVAEDSTDEPSGEE